MMIPMALMTSMVGSRGNESMIPKDASVNETGIEKIIVEDRTACTTLAFPIPSARM
jgi:hypothetical protein